MPLLLLLLLLAAPSIGHTLDSAQLNRLAAESFHKGQYLQALDKLRQAGEQNPYNPRIQHNLAEALLAAAGHLTEEGEWDRAVSLYQEGNDRFPEDVRFPLYLAHLLLQQERFSEAEVAAGTVLGLDPDSVEALLILGQVNYRTGRLRDAMETWRQAAEIAPEDARIADLLARAEREYRVEADMTRDYGAGFVLSYDGKTLGGMSQDILAVLNEAAIEIGSLLDFFPSQKVQVLVYTHRQFRQAVDSPDWAGGVYDGKIRIPLAGIRQMTPPLRGLLFHEYAHVVVRQLSHGRCPVWLNEGIAEVMASSQTEVSSTRPLDASALIPFRELGGSWRDLSPDRARQAYRQSRSFVRFLAESYGWYSIRELLGQYAAGKGGDEAFAAVFGDYGLGLSDLVDNWRRRELN
ncbi:MAG: hypothetical protein D6794_06525 [Deltaproteobacteria bacterium]|nr:MAG: hypothetical protein D6794_06525 [Deltaproteobacteria bacterium]